MGRLYNAGRLGIVAILAVAFLPLWAVAAGADEPWVVFPGGHGPGAGKNVVFVTGDEEYRSEESMPQLARILAVRHGFHSTVLFAVNKKDGTIDPQTVDNIPGLAALDTADLMVIFTRFRELPDEQMKHIIDYVNSGRPIVGLRTATHAFRYVKHKDSPYAKYSWDHRPDGGFGREVLGETWVAHYGHHQHESTRGLIAGGMAASPLVRGADDVWGPSDVYAITTLSGNAKPVVMGQVLTGMDPHDPPNKEKHLVPVAWVKSYTGTSGKPVRGVRHHHGPRRRSEERGLPPVAGQRLLLVPGDGGADSRPRGGRFRRQVRSEPHRHRQAQEGAETGGLQTRQGPDAITVPPRPQADKGDTSAHSYVSCAVARQGRFTPRPHPMVLKPSGNTCDTVRPAGTTKV